MLEQPLVSIIIPTYNRAHLIGETLDSVLAQTYQNWECLVVDDGSTDGTKSVISQYITNDGRIKFFKRPENKPKGANACRNIGLNEAQGKYIVFFDSDDLMYIDFIEKQAKTLKDNEELDFCANFSSFFNVNGETEWVEVPENIENKNQLEKLFNKYNLEVQKEYKNSKKDEILYENNLTFGGILILKKYSEDEFILKLNYLDDEYILITPLEENISDKLILNLLVFLDILVLALIFLYILKLLSPIKIVTKTLQIEI